MNTLRSFSRLVRPCQKVRQMSDESVTRQNYERGLNQIHIMGRVGANVELRGNEDNKVCTFRVATNDVFVDKKTGEERRRTEWHAVSVFNPYLKDSVAINLRKGDKVFLTGKLRYYSFTDKMGNVVKVSYIAPDVLFNLTNRYLTQQYDEEEEEEE